LTPRRVVLVLLVVALLGAVGGAWWVKQLATAAATEPGPATVTQEFVITPGTSLRGALRLLQAKQLVTSARHLEWYLRYSKPDPLGGRSVQAGRYRIEAGHTPLEILEQLVEGRVVMEQVTVIEGWTFAQMRALLARLPDLRQTIAGLDDAQIMAELGAPGVAAEGRFAPDTYAYAPEATSDMQILRMAYEAQTRNLQAAWESRQPDLPLASADEALTLASIIEKETALAGERTRVAGVYVNRLRRGMRLQSDPTVIYGIRDHYDGNIHKRDLTTDTPYNTYTRSGLPPTPIALPGREAIIAAVNPEKTDALYFVAIGDGSGGHYFSATYAEHTRALKRYLDRLHTNSLLDQQAGTSKVDASQP
jgi:peptidoglycan lytic transglycosylase G